MPQVEEGYTRIANELLEAILQFGFSKREWAVVMCVIRKTYGFQKKTDIVSMWQISKMTGIKNNHVGVTVTDLINRNILTTGDHSRFRHGQEVKSIGINKRYQEWLAIPKAVTVPETVPVPKQDDNHSQIGTEPFPKQEPQKKLTKEKPKERVNPFENWPEEPKEDQWSEIMAIRKTKKARNTQRAFDAIGKQLTEAVNRGYRFQDCLDVWERRQWAGFELAWYENQLRQNNGSNQKRNLSAVDKVRVAQGLLPITSH